MSGCSLEFPRLEGVVVFLVLLNGTDVTGFVIVDSMSMNEGHFGSSNVGEHPMGTSKVSSLLGRHISGKGPALPARPPSKRRVQCSGGANELLRHPHMCAMAVRQLNDSLLVSTGLSL
jgi:hypothetical protein